MLRALLIFAVGRIVTLAWILGVGVHRGMSMSQTIGYWDGSWYIQAAKAGWPSVVPNLPPETAGQDTTAFFPGYPLLIRLVHLSGLDWTASALVATLLAGAIASVLIAVVVNAFSSQQIALLTVALYRQRWLLAGLLAAAASGTRSVAAALTVVALIAATRAWLSTPRSQRFSWHGLRPWLAPALSPIGVLAYFAFLRHLLGSWTAWFDVEQRGWHMHSDPGVSVVTNTVRALSKTGRFFGHPRGTLVPEGMIPIVLVVAVALAIALIVLGRRGVVPIEVWSYGVVFLLLIFITGNSYASLPRVLVPAFPLLIPLARWMATKSPIVTVVILGLSLTAASYLGVLWFDTIRLATHCCAP